MAQKRGAERTKPSKPEELEARIDFAEEQLRLGVPPAQVRNSLVEEFKLTKQQAANVLDKAYVELGAELERSKPYQKVLQVERLQTQIAAAMAKGKMNEAIRGEAVLSTILGTRAPTRVEMSGDVTVSQAMLRIVGAMTADEQDRLVAEQEEVEARARAAMNGAARA